MAIIAENNDGRQSYKYKALDMDELYARASELLEVCRVYVENCPDLEWKDISCDFPSLFEIIIRVDKRKDYFNVFHEHTEINEAKEAALLAYWILKFRPFSKSEKSTKRYDNINEIFSVFILFSAIKKETKRGNGKRFTMSREYIRKLSYAFRYWDISKEAMMLVSESLSEAMR